MVTLLATLCSGLALAAVPSISTPVSFEPNQGQTDARVKYLARDHGSTIWFTQQGPVFGIAGKSGQRILKMRFEGGNRAPKIEGENRQGGASNYFIGPDQSKWRTGVPHFGKVRYRDVYPGIDVLFYGNPQKMEYDFVVAPGANPSRIRLAFDGADSLAEISGDLVLESDGIEIRNRKPVIYQGNKTIAGHYVLCGKSRAGFVVGRYDRSQALVIDPVLTYATYLGGAYGEQANGIAMDAQGNVVVVGYTTSTNFPTKSPLYPTYPSNPNSFTNPPTEVFVTKINPSASGGASILFSTFYGASFGAAADAVAVDKSGNIYVTGRTYDGTIPLKNAFQPTLVDGGDCGGSGGSPGTHYVCPDAFVAEFSPAGDQLLFASLLGGSEWDEGYGIAVDASANIYVVGYTLSIGFPQRGQAYQTSVHGTQNAFLSMISPAGSLVYSTPFGGDGTSFYSVAVDASGMVYAGGYTSSAQIATTGGAFQTSLQGTGSGIVVKFNLTLGGAQAAVYCTYLGGSGGASIANAIATDSSGNIYVAGGTTSPNFPVSQGGARTTYVDGLNYLGGITGDAFATKLNPSAQGAAQLAYSTFAGGSFDDTATGIAVDSAGRITIVGITDSIDYPASADAFQCCYAGIFEQGFLTQYGFLARFDPSKSGGLSQVYSTLLGGSLNTHLNAIAGNATGSSVAVAGFVQSTDTPVTAGAFQTKFGGQVVNGTSLVDEAGDAYVARFDFSTANSAISFIENGAGLSALTMTYLSPGLIFTVKGMGLGPATGVLNQSLDPVTGFVANNVSGVQVLVDGVAVPLIYVSATQINAVAPYELANKAGATIYVQVVYNGVPGSLMPATVAATAPGIFSFDDGSGQGAIRNQDQSINGAGNPAAVGSIISIYATGEGQLTPALQDGQLATDYNNLPKPVAKVSVTIGGVAATNIQYAGTAPGGIAGFFQLNVVVPAGVKSGSAVPVVLTVGSAASQPGLTMAIQ